MPSPDLSQYTRKPHVAIVDSFSDPELTLTQELLAEIVENNNTRIADTGDMSPLIIGHTAEDVSELEQPPIIGWATNFSLGTLGNVNPRPCIYADFLLRPDQAHLVEQYPRRSIELMQPENYIDGIALLGATTPRRSLGLLFSKASGKKRFEFNAEQVDMDPQQMVKLCMEAFAATPQFQFLNKLMTDQGAAQGDEQKDQASTDTPAAPVRNEATHVPTLDCPKGEEQNKPEKAAMAKGNDETVRLEQEITAIKLQRDDHAIKLARVESELAEVRKLADAAALKLRRKERETDLKQLVFEGYQFDLAEELSYVDALPDDQYTAYVGKIKSRFQRVPVGRSPIAPQLLTVPAPQNEESQKDMAVKARNYALKHKCDYGTAMEKIRVGEKV